MFFSFLLIGSFFYGNLIAMVYGLAGLCKINCAKLLPALLVDGDTVCLGAW